MSTGHDAHDPTKARWTEADIPVADLEPEETADEPMTEPTPDTTESDRCPSCGLSTSDLDAIADENLCRDDWHTESELTGDGLGKCLDCAHPEHEMTCHETVSNGDPSNGPVYCPCAVQIEWMEQEIVRLRTARDTPENERTGDGLREALEAARDGFERIARLAGNGTENWAIQGEANHQWARSRAALAALPNREAAPRRQYDSEPLDLREAAERVLDWADWQQPWNPAGDFDALRKATGRRLPEGDEPIGPRYYFEAQR